MGIISSIASRKGAVFAVGAVAGLLLPPALKSKAARRAAVSVTAKGLQLKDDAADALTGIKEDAQDVYAEAKQKNAVGGIAAE